MSNTLPIQKWLDVVKAEYLDGFIKEGGAAVKFAVPVAEGLGPLLKTRLSEIASGLGYLVAAVDSGETRVHMPQEIFFRVAQQIDWHSLARRMVLKLCIDKGYKADSIDIQDETPIIEALSQANSVEESMIALEIRNPLFRAVTKNTNMSRDFRMAMTQLCRAEMGGVDKSQYATPIMEWLTGSNRRIANVRSYSIYNGIVRTNARHLLESLLYWVHLAGYSGTVVLLSNSRVTLRRNPRDGSLFYSRPAVMDHYELLRELIDSTDRLQGFLGIILSNEDFLDDDPRRKGVPIYQALQTRIADEVLARNQANPMATLVRLAY